MNSKAKIGDWWLTTSGTFAKIVYIKEGELARADIFKSMSVDSPRDWPLGINTNCTDEFLVKKITPEKYPEYFL